MGFKEIKKPEKLTYNGLLAIINGYHQGKGFLRKASAAGQSPGMLELETFVNNYFKNINFYKTNPDTSLPFEFLYKLHHKLTEIKMNPKIKIKENSLTSESISKIFDSINVSYADVEGRFKLVDDLKRNIAERSRTFDSYEIELQNILSNNNISINVKLNNLELLRDKQAKDLEFLDQQYSQLLAMSPEEIKAYRDHDKIIIRHRIDEREFVSPAYYVPLNRHVGDSIELQNELKSDFSTTVSKNFGFGLKLDKEISSCKALLKPNARPDNS